MWVPMWICVVVVLFVVFKDGWFWFWCSLWYWACCDCIAYLLLLLLLLLLLVALIHKLYIIHNLIVYSLKIFNPFSSYALSTGHPPNITTLLISGIIFYKLECHVAFLKVYMYNILVDESYILYSFYLYLLVEVRVSLM